MRSCYKTLGVAELSALCYVIFCRHLDAALCRPTIRTELQTVQSQNNVQKVVLLMHVTLIIQGGESCA